MSSLIVITVIVPLVIGLLAGFVQLWRPATLVQHLLAAVIVVAVFLLLEGVPPLPPISSKHKLAIVAGLFVLAAPLTGRLGTGRLVGLSALLLAASLVWIGSSRLAPAAAWPAAIWLLPLPVLLGVLGARRTADPVDDYFAPRIGITFSAIAAAGTALLGGFVGMAQLEGALAAAIGGALVVSFIAHLAGRDALPSAIFRPANWLLAMVHSAIVLTVACFAPSISPLALYLAALPMAVAWMPAPGGMPARVRPVFFGIVAALPAAAAIGVAYWSSLAPSAG